MSKPEIKEYLESIYNVSVKSVNTKVGALLSCLARAQPLFSMREEGLTRARQLLSADSQLVFVTSIRKTAEVPRFSCLGC